MTEPNGLYERQVVTWIKGELDRKREEFLVMAKRDAKRYSQVNDMTPEDRLSFYTESWPDLDDIDWNEAVGADFIHENARTYSEYTSEDAYDAVDLDWIASDGSSKSWRYEFDLSDLGAIVRSLLTTVVPFEDGPCDCTPGKSPQGFDPIPHNKSEHYTEEEMATMGWQP